MFLLGSVFALLSSIPLFAIGLSTSHKAALKTSALAAILIFLLTKNIRIAALFFFILALPSWYICYVVLRYYDIKLAPPLPSLRLWYPVGLVTLAAAIYGNTLLAIITAIFSAQEVNLPQYLFQNIQQNILPMIKDSDVDLNAITQDISFIMCSISVWLWCSILLASAWLTNNMLVKKNLAKRPNLAITPFPMPYWLLSLMAIWALASLIGGESMRFLGKSSLIILLLPYFFQGAALLHTNSKNWHNRRFFLFFIYLSIIIFVWPALIIAGSGVWMHIKTFNKHLSSGGNSSKS